MTEVRPKCWTNNRRISLQCPEAFFFSPDDRSKVMGSKFKPRRIGMILVEDIPKEDASSITNADVTVERSLS